MLEKCIHIPNSHSYWGREAQGEVRNIGCNEEPMCCASRGTHTSGVNGAQFCGTGEAGWFKAVVSGWINRATCGVSITKGRGF